jgi:hypothetical protein
MTAPLSPAALASAARDERLDAHTKAQAAVAARDAFNRRRDLAERVLLALVTGGCMAADLNATTLAKFAWGVAQRFDENCAAAEAEMCGTEGGR